MSYLQINGYQVPVKECEPAYVPIANGSAYSPSGAYQLNRNGQARSWKVRTSLLDSEMRLALAEMLSERGESWRFDLGADPDGVLYVPDDSVDAVWSTSKRVPKSAINCTVLSSYGADGSRCVDWNNTPIAPFSGCSGAVMVDAGTTNLFTQNESNPESGALGWTASGAALVVADTSNYWTGSASARLQTAAGGTAISSSRTVSGSTQYVVSMRVKYISGDLTAVIRVVENDGAATTTTTATSLYSTDRWVTITHTFTTQAGTTACTVELLPSIATADYCFDGCLLEANADGLPTAWINAGVDAYGSGAGVRPAGVLDFDSFCSSYVNGFTLSAWVNLQIVGRALEHGIIDLGDSSPRATLYFYDNSSDRFTLKVFASDGSTLQPLSSSYSTPGWYHVVGTYDAGTRTARVYVNGVLDGTDSSWSGAKQYYDGEKLLGDFSIGTFGAAGLNTFGGTIGPVMVLPFPAPADMVSGWYDLSQDTFGYPSVPVPGILPFAVSGDVLGTSEPYVYCYASVDAMPHIQWEKNGVWQGHGGELAFTLREVAAR